MALVLIPTENERPTGTSGADSTAGPRADHGGIRRPTPSRGRMAALAGLLAVGLVSAVIALFPHSGGPSQPAVPAAPLPAPTSPAPAPADGVVLP